MKSLAPKMEQFVVNADGHRVAVLLDVATYDRLREAEEELADLRAYDDAKARTQAEMAKGDFVTLADYRGARTAKSK